MHANNWAVHLWRHSQLIAARMHVIEKYTMQRLLRAGLRKVEYPPPPAKDNHVAMYNLTIAIASIVYFKKQFYYIWIWFRMKTCIA